MRLGLDSLLSFERLGHLKTAGLVSADGMRSLTAEIDRLYAHSEHEAYSQKVRVLLGADALRELPSVAEMRSALEALPEGSVPFMQLFNLWRSSPRVLALLSSEVRTWVGGGVAPPQRTPAHRTPSRPTPTAHRLNLTGTRWYGRLPPRPLLKREAPSLPRLALCQAARRRRHTVALSHLDITRRSRADHARMSRPDYRKKRPNCTPQCASIDTPHYFPVTPAVPPAVPPAVTPAVPPALKLTI